MASRPSLPCHSGCGTPPSSPIPTVDLTRIKAYDMSKLLIFAATPNRKSESLSIPELAAAGFLSAIPTTLITAPVERAKVLLQVQGQGGAAHQYSGVADVMKHLYKEGGIRSIFRGSVATVARDGPGSAAYFAAYEVTKKALTPAGSSPSDLNLGAIIFAGGMAGVAMWSLAIPPDVCQTTSRRLNGSHIITGHKVAYTIGPHRDLFRIHGLCQKDDCCRWCQSIMERIWPRDGTGM